MRHRPLGGPPRPHLSRLLFSSTFRLPCLASPRLPLSAPDLNQNQTATEKPTEKSGNKTEAERNDDDTGTPPENPQPDTEVPPERLHAQVVESAHQGPPPLTAAAKMLINSEIRGSTKKTYRSMVNTFADYCAKQNANTKSCHPNIVINYFTMLAVVKGLSYQTISGHRSAIAKQHIGVGGLPLGMLPEIKRLARAIFIDRPPLPRYAKCWDVLQTLP